MDIRPYRDSDLDAVVELFTASVHELAAGHYDARQREAWAPRPWDATAWRTRLSHLVTLVAEDGASRLAGFVACTDTGHVDLLFVAPSHHGRGVARRLYERAEDALAARGVTELTTAASRVARPFFERQGFVATDEEEVTVRGVRLHRFPMAKRLVAGRLLAVWLRPAARLPVRAVPRATAVAGGGLEGDHAGGGRRAVTLLAIEAWREACAELGRDLDPAVRRANLLVEGLDLGATLGAELRIADVVLEVLGELRPCELLDDDGRAGLCAALRPARRGGVHARIVRGGELAVGMPLVVRRTGGRSP